MGEEGNHISNVPVYLDEEEKGEGDFFLFCNLSLH